MKRNLGTMIVFIGLVLLFSSATFAAPERTTLIDTTVSQHTTAAGDPKADLSTKGIDYDLTPAPSPPSHLSLVERLSLQNAVCALWYNSMKQDPAPMETLDPMDLEAPDNIFVAPSSNVSFNNGEWVFEGLIRQMAPDSTGIEVISDIQYYNVRFKKLEDSRFHIRSVLFEHIQSF